MKTQDVTGLLGAIGIGIVISAVHIGWFVGTLYGALWVEWNFGDSDGSRNDGFLGFFAFIAIGICLVPIPASFWVWVTGREANP